jgi:hypothetical protein
VHLPLKVLGDENIPTGVTENISAAGIYLRVGGPMEIGSSIEFEITIPGDTIGADDDVRLHCDGRVIRCDTEKDPERTGVACVIERYEFVRAAKVGGE